MGFAVELVKNGRLGRLFLMCLCERLLFSLALILALSIPQAALFAAETISEITVVTSVHQPAGIADEALLSAGHQPNVGDKLLLKSEGRVIDRVSVSRSKMSSLGNVVIRGRTGSGGRALIVIDQQARVTGHLVDASGVQQLTTDQYGTIHVWQEGIDTIPGPTGNDVVLPRREISEPNPSFGRIERVAARPAAPAALARSDNVSTSYPRYASGTASVRLLLYYDSSMAAYVSGLADFLVEITNDALIDSQVELALELAGLISIDLDDLVPNSDVLNAMSNATSPFESIANDRDEYLADLTATLRDAEDGWPEDESGGVAYRGSNFDIETVSVNRYTSYQPGQPFYSSYTLAHEIGHNLSANHDRGEYTEAEANELPGFSYAFGYRVYDSHKTIMSYGYESRAPYFSNPLLNYAGQPLGKSFSAADSADVSRAFTANRHVAASLKGDSFQVDVMKSRWYRYESDCGYELAEGEEQGEWRYVTLRNVSSRPVEIHSLNYVRADGTLYTTEYERGEKYEGGPDDTLTWAGYCWMPGDPPNPLGTTYSETYWLYYHPDTQELIETSHFPWTENFDANHSLVRVAYGDGGTVAGHTELFVEVGGSKTLEFIPDAGFQLSEIKSTCDGAARGSLFDLTATDDDCVVEARFARDETGNLDSLTTEQEIQLVYTGLLGRAADRPGLAYWQNEIGYGQFTIEDLRHNIVNYQEEYLTTLGSLGRYDLVNELYLNLFSRNPEEAGHAYWVWGGGATVSIDRLVLALMDGAGPTDTQTLLNKAEAATYYTNRYVEYLKQDATTVVGMVDSTESSVQQAKDYVEGGGSGSGGGSGADGSGVDGSDSSSPEAPSTDYCAGYNPNLADCQVDQNFDPWISATGKSPYWIRDRLTEVIPFTLPSRAEAIDTHYGYLQLTTGELNRNAKTQDIFHMWVSETPEGPKLDDEDCEWYGTQARHYWYWTQDQATDEANSGMCFLGTESRVLYVNFETRCYEPLYTGSCSDTNKRKSSAKYQFDVARRIKYY